MNLTGHIVGKDLFRLRWILVLWAIVLTARMALAVIQSELDVAGYYPFYVMALVFGRIFLPLLGFGLVMGVQGDDPVSDSDAFWITRPISASRLLGAKCLVLASLWSIPSLVMAPWWIAHGFDLGQLCVAVLQTTSWQAALTMLALPFAVISPSASRFFMSVLLAATGSFAFVLVYQFSHFDSAAANPPEASVARAWVIPGLWAAAAAAIILVQFLTRRTRLSIAILTTALAACCALACAWSWKLLPPAATAGEVLRVPAPVFHLASATAGRDTTVHVAYGAGQRENDRVAIVGAITHQLTWPDDSVFIASPLSSGDPLAQACSAFVLGNTDGPGISSDFALPDQARWRRMRHEAPRYLATITGTVMHAEILATIQPRTGEVSLQHGLRLKIAEVVPDFRRGMVLTVNESNPDLVAGAWPRLLGRSEPSPAREYYFLVKRDEGRAMLGTAKAVGESLTAGPLAYSRKELVFPMDGAQFGRWAGTALLVKVAAYDDGPFTATVAVPHFAVEAATEDKTAAGASHP
jgi:hypothetical protein